MGLLFQLAIFAFGVWVILKFKNKAMALFNDVFNRTAVTYKVRQRGYSPAAVVMEHTKYTALPSCGIYGTYIQAHWTDVTEILITEAKGNKMYGGTDLYTLSIEVLTDTPHMSIFAPFFKQYNGISARMPLIEYLYAIKGGLDVVN